MIDETLWDLYCCPLDRHWFFLCHLLLLLLQIFDVSALR
jgi:hypothetical protein